MPLLLHTIDNLSQRYSVRPEGLHSRRILLPAYLIKPLKQEAIKRVHQQHSFNVRVLRFICNEHSIKVSNPWNLQECLPYDSNLRNIHLLTIFITLYRLDMLFYNPLNNPIPSPFPKAILLNKILWEPLKRVIIVPRVLPLRTHIPGWRLFSLRRTPPRPNMCIKLLNLTKLSFIVHSHHVEVNHLNFRYYNLPILWVLPRIFLIHLYCTVRCLQPQWR